ncbi:MAG: UDP-glucose 4-epimerase [Armatimonadetes bacterium CG_4_9_14_3_um_filter_66_14]|nr:MAG: UDP-glucose 4-epimerase [Armatimonadetes bacterium CG_4_9_14_3_um_filter_66_14]
MEKRVTLRDKSVLVTGGAGFIGSHVVDAVVRERPKRVVVVDNLFLGREENLAEARAARGDLTFYCQNAGDLAVMRRILADNGVEVVFDLAVIPLPTSLEKPKWSVDQSVLVTTTLCQLAVDGAFQTLVHFSSSEALGSAKIVPMVEDHPLAPLTPYAAAKAASDHIVLSHCHTFGLDAAILRPFNNYGPRQNDKAYAGILPIAINKVLAGETIEIFGDGEQTRDFIFVKDTAAAAVALYGSAATRGCVTNVATGRETTVNELVRTILRLMGAEDHPVMHVAPRPADVRRHCADLTKARERLGFEPTTELAEGLRQTIDWYLAKAGQVRR